MKIRTQRLISMILIVCLYLMFLPAAIIHTKALSTDMIVDAAREIIYRNEGPYGSVNRNDCSPTTLNAAGIQTITVTYGDANGDGTVNMKDLTVLRRMLASGDVILSVVNGNPDANGDGEVNLIDVIFLHRYLAGGWGVELPELPEPEADGPLAEDLSHYSVLTTEKSPNGVTCTSFRFGQSVLGRDLVCWSLQQGDYSRTVLLNFAIHGWEDSYAADARLLVDLGNALVEHYAAASDMKNCRLLIVPCANPDGLEDGTTNNGFGRCNADGIDLNRDFDASHIVYTNARNYTPAPFSGAESRALRDLVLAAKADVVIDFHGWLNYTIGNKDLAEVFSLCTDLCHKYELGTGSHGYFSYWAQLQGAEAILVEFKDTTSVIHSDVIHAVDKLISNNYGSHQTDYTLDTEFEVFDTIVAFADTNGKVYTQKSVGNTGTDYGYINGTSDECTILQIYNNGWCKVRYPVGALFKTGYCQLSSFIGSEAAVSHYSAHTTANTKVYTTSAMTTQLGTVWSTDVFTVVAEKSGLVQIIYPLDSGGYKMGWINASAVQQN